MPTVDTKHPSRVLQDCTSKKDYEDVIAQYRELKMDYAYIDAAYQRMRPLVNRGVGR